MITAPVAAQLAAEAGVGCSAPTLLGISRQRSGGPSPSSFYLRDPSVLLCYTHCVSIHLERRAVLRPGLSVIVDSRGGDLGVAEPLLLLGDVGLVIECIGGGSRAQCVHPDLDRETSWRRKRSGTIGSPISIIATGRVTPML